jgi:hypothetical protein
VDARDFFRGLRPWDQFHTYVKTLALTEGTQFWAAQLEDERFDGELETKLEELKRKPPEPPSLVGYNRLIAAIDEMTDHIHMLRAESGRWATAPRARAKPRFPADRVHERKVALSRGLVNDILEQAHALVRATS